MANKNTKGEKMKRKLFFSVLMVVLIFFVTGIGVAGQGKNKGADNTNKQSLETSTRNKERAEQRHQIKEGGEFGKEGSASVGNGREDEEKKGKKDKKDIDDNDSDDEEKGKKEKKKKGKENNDDTENKEGSSSDEEPQKETKRRWWEFNKK
jgi:preprotein translocase subunit SecF